LLNCEIIFQKVPSNPFTKKRLKSDSVQMSKKRILSASGNKEAERAFNKTSPNSRNR